jgi:hypothetical protein
MRHGPISLFDLVGISMARKYDMRKLLVSILSTSWARFFARRRMLWVKSARRYRCRRKSWWPGGALGNCKYCSSSDANTCQWPCQEIVVRMPAGWPARWTSADLAAEIDVPLRLTAWKGVRGISASMFFRKRIFPKTPLNSPLIYLFVSYQRLEFQGLVESARFKKFRILRLQLLNKHLQLARVRQHTPRGWGAYALISARHWRLANGKT